MSTDGGKGKSLSYNRRQRAAFVEVQDQILSPKRNKAHNELGITPMENYIMKREIDRDTVADPDYEDEQKTTA